ncbi:MAG: S8 family serine peptidase [Flavobacterium sp.]
MSLYHEVFQGESFSEDNYFEAVRYVLGPEYANLNESELENVLLSRVDQMSESEAEGFWFSLGNVASSIGSGVLRGVAAVAPIAGTAIGTYFGAPQIGGALGGLVSNLAGAGSAALDNNRQPQHRPAHQQQQYRRPANNSIVVGAYNQNDDAKSILSFSSSGPTADGRMKPELVAPGFKIRSSCSSSSRENRASNKLTSKSGSSMAAPYVASLVMKILEKEPHLDITSIRKRLFDACDTASFKENNLEIFKAGHGYINPSKIT